VTWTYTNNPSNSNRDLVRTLISDTNSSDQKLSDEFITYALAAKPNVYLAAALCAQSVGASYAAVPSHIKVGDLSQSVIAGYQNEYRQLAKSLRVQAMTAATPYSGGISVDDKQTQRNDSDWDRPAFERGMHDHSRSLSTDTSGWR
jgi:hypothetical protein